MSSCLLVDLSSFAIRILEVYNGLIASAIPGAREGLVLDAFIFVCSSSNDVKKQESLWQVD
ncbi:hypothetical protein FBY10_101138 [Pseudomonas sp. SJZ103]|nr:hypothetical protein [Pseudomonas sp. SJZ073]MBB6313776.1 hypothetical protein [Pseudomonas sp. JAI120]MCS4309794.1 hypothetical protein [Pseudomonas sp. BIGb0381]TWC74448.1 hypothetical protein FBY10_101138 [Pseudomonas sp. SJZ103]TWC93423.1 hypothetical protein FBY08_101920 [Pseudomonas sp. SJZ094]